MAIEIINNYNAVYESTYAAQKQQAAKGQVTSKEETKETAASKKSSGTDTGNNEYFNKLKKLAPSVEFRLGNAHASTKNGKTLTINPKVLERMQNDPAFEKEMMDLIKGVESMTKLSDSINKATGWTTVYRNGYIDENGKYTHIALVRNDYMLNLSDKLREERRKNAEELIEITKEKSAQKEEELLELLEEKRTEKEDEEKEEEEEEKEAEITEEITGKAEKLINKKIAASKNGMIYMDDEEFRELLEAIKEEEAEEKAREEAENSKKSVQPGSNFDMQI